MWPLFEWNGKRQTWICPTTLCETNICRKSDLPVVLSFILVSDLSFLIQEPRLLLPHPLLCHLLFPPCWIHRPVHNLLFCLPPMERGEAVLHCWAPSSPSVKANWGRLRLRTAAGPQPDLHPLSVSPSAGNIITVTWRHCGSALWSGSCPWFLTCEKKSFIIISGFSWF